MNATEERLNNVRGYRIGSDWYPSVSAVLDVLVPPKMEYVELAHLERGTLLHATMEHWITGNGSATASLNGWLPAIHAAKAWASKHIKSVVSVEHVYTSTFGFAGRPDCPVLTTQEEPEILDWKFCTKIPGIRLHDQLQGEAYRHLDFSATGLGTARWRTRLVYVAQNGDIFAPKLPTSPTDWGAFLAALTVVKFRMKH